MEELLELMRSDDETERLDGAALLAEIVGSAFDADGASELQRPDAPFWGQAHDGARRPPPSRLASNKPAAAWDRVGGDLPLLRSQSATAIRLYSGPRRVEASLTGSPMRAAPSAPRAAWLSPRMRRGESRGLFE